MRADEGRLPRPHGAWTELIHFSPVEQHIRNRAHTRLCDSRPAPEIPALELSGEVDLGVYDRLLAGGAR